VAAASAAAAVRPWIFLENYITPVSSYTHYYYIIHLMCIIFTGRHITYRGIKLTPFRPGARDGPSPVTPSISPRPQQTFNFFLFFVFRLFVLTVIILPYRHTLKEMKIMTWMHTAADNECANTAGIYAQWPGRLTFF
jgi:hypothetical protein